MAIETTRDRDTGLTIHTVSGPVTEEDMYAALEDPDPTPLILWDMSGAEVDHVTPLDLQRFVGRAAALGMKRKGGRTAVLAPDDLQFGLARMSEAFTEMDATPFGFRAFRDRDEALQWLTSG